MILLRYMLTLIPGVRWSNDNVLVLSTVVIVTPSGYSQDCLRVQRIPHLMQRKKDHRPTGPRTAGSICSKKHHGCYKKQFDKLTWIGNLPLHWIELAHRCSGFQLSLWRSEGNARNYAEVACWEPLEPETHSGSLSAMGSAFALPPNVAELVQAKDCRDWEGNFQKFLSTSKLFPFDISKTTWNLLGTMIRLTAKQKGSSLKLPSTLLLHVITIMIAVGLGSVHFSGGAFKPQSILQLQITYFKCRRCVAFFFVHSPLPCIWLVRVPLVPPI